MPRTNKPTRTQESAKTAPAQPTPVITQDRFPLAQYASVLGVHLTLVGFTALYLPQMTRVFVPLATRETDRPQTDFMATLTADTSLTLGWIAVGLTVLEVWWASWMRRWFFAQSAKGTEVEVRFERVRFDGLQFTRLRDASAFTLCATLATHVVLVLFGAPLVTHVLQTALLAFVIAILTVFTPAFVLGLPSFASDTPSLIGRVMWTRLFAELSPKNAIEFAMVYPFAGTFIGGWLGAIPIALDWERPWQAWPLTPLFGSLGGYILGALWALTLSTAGWLARENIQAQASKQKTS